MQPSLIHAQDKAHVCFQIPYIWCCFIVHCHYWCTAPNGSASYFPTFLTNLISLRSPAFLLVVCMMVLVLLSSNLFLGCKRNKFHFQHTAVVMHTFRTLSGYLALFQQIVEAAKTSNNYQTKCFPLQGHEACVLPYHPAIRHKLYTLQFHIIVRIHADLNY